MRGNFLRILAALRCRILSRGSRLHFACEKNTDSSPGKQTGTEEAGVS